MKKSLWVFSSVVIALILGWLIYKDATWTEEKAIRSAENEVERACARWNVNRAMLTNRTITQESGNSWTVRYTDAKGEIWVEVAFGKRGGVETFTNLNDKISSIERQLKQGIQPKDVKH